MYLSAGGHSDAGLLEPLLCGAYRFESCRGKTGYFFTDIDLKKIQTQSQHTTNKPASFYFKMHPVYVNKPSNVIRLLMSAYCTKT